MAKARTELTWTEIEPASLPEEQQARYAEYKAAYKAMRAARDAFEASLQAAAPAGKRIVCGYNFGKLSIALADKEPERAKPTQDLAAWLKQNVERGR